MLKEIAEVLELKEKDGVAMAFVKGFAEGAIITSAVVGLTVSIGSIFAGMLTKETTEEK